MKWHLLGFTFHSIIIKRGQSTSILQSESEVDKPFCKVDDELDI